MSVTFKAMSFAAAIAAALVALGTSTDANAIERCGGKRVDTCQQRHGFNRAPHSGYWSGKDHTAVGKSFDGSPAALASQNKGSTPQSSGNHRYPEYHGSGSHAGGRTAVGKSF
jgi:hypothetical protein